MRTRKLRKVHTSCKVDLHGRGGPARGQKLDILNGDEGDEPLPPPLGEA